MHFLFDLVDTLTEGEPDRWREIFAMIRENGHTISLLTSGRYDHIEEELYFKKSEFDRVFAGISKTSRATFHVIAAELKSNSKDMCLFDNDPEIVRRAHDAGIDAIQFTTQEQARNILIARMLQQKTPA